MKLPIKIGDRVKFGSKSYSSEGVISSITGPTWWRLALSYLLIYQEPMFSFGVDETGGHNGYVLRDGEFRGRLGRGETIELLESGHIATQTSMFDLPGMRVTNPRSRPYFLQMGVDYTHMVWNCHWCGDMNIEQYESSSPDRLPKDGKDRLRRCWHCPQCGKYGLAKVCVIPHFDLDLVGNEYLWGLSHYDYKEILERSGLAADDYPLDAYPYQHGHPNIGYHKSK